MIPISWGSCNFPCEGKIQTPAVKRVLGDTWGRNGCLHFSNNVISAVKSKLILWVMFCLGAVQQTEVCRMISREGLKQALVLATKQEAPTCRLSAPWGIHLSTQCVPLCIQQRAVLAVRVGPAHPCKSKGTQAMRGWKGRKWERVWACFSLTCNIYELVRTTTPR